MKNTKCNIYVNIINEHARSPFRTVRTVRSALVSILSHPPPSSFLTRGNQETLYYVYHYLFSFFFFFSFEGISNLQKNCKYNPKKFFPNHLRMSPT